jgi:hypothetical protein
VPDGIGGVYSVLSSTESFAGQWTGYAHIQHFDGANFWDSVLVVSDIDRPYSANAPDGGLVVFNYQEGTYVQKIALDGSIVWPEPVQMLSSTLDVVNQTPASDLNGGVLLAFWKTLGGIYVQHSGRDGNLGVLTSISDERLIPSGLSLHQNYPNPFNSQTTIEFSVRTPAHVLIQVYNLLGQRVADVVDAPLDAGSYRVLFDASELASGIYLCTMSGGGSRHVRKMSLLR